MIKTYWLQGTLMVYCYEEDEEKVYFQYVNEHTPHTPSSIEDVQFLPKSNALHEQILDEQCKGYNVRQVRQYLQREYREVFQVILFVKFLN